MQAFSRSVQTLTSVIHCAKPVRFPRLGLALATLVGLLCGAGAQVSHAHPPADAGGAAGPGHHHDHDHDHKVDIEFISTGHAWAWIGHSAEAIAKGLEDGNMKLVHDSEVVLAAGLAHLQGHSDMVTGDRARRLEAALRQARQISAALHHAADHEDAEGVAAQLARLRGALRLVEAQYPAEALEPPADEPATPDQ